LDADKEGFLRSERSLIQTIGRAARNLEGTALLYADTVTDSMRRALEETERRRDRQSAFNETHGIVPRGVQKDVRELIDGIVNDVASDAVPRGAEAIPSYQSMSERQLGREIKRLEKQMLDAAKNLQFEKAAEYRDQLTVLRERVFGLGNEMRMAEIEKAA